MNALSRASPTLPIEAASNVSTKGDRQQIHYADLRSMPYTDRPDVTIIQAPKSQYEQIADLLPGRIADRTYPPGSALPSEPEQSTELGVYSARWA